MHFARSAAALAALSLAGSLAVVVAPAAQATAFEYGSITVTPPGPYAGGEVVNVAWTGIDATSAGTNPGNDGGFFVGYCIGDGQPQTGTGACGPFEGGGDFSTAADPITGTHYYFGAPNVLPDGSVNLQIPAYGANAGFTDYSSAVCDNTTHCNIVFGDFAGDGPAQVQIDYLQPGVDVSALFRLAGATRYTTAVAGSQYAFDADAAGAVVLARGDSFADALPGGALATAVDGPLLLTPPTSLQPDTLTEIQRVLPNGGTVYLLGGTGALSAAVESAVTGAGFSTVRVFGADRYSTSLAIADRIETILGAGAEHLFVATGLNFPDGLAAAAAAAAYNTAGSTSPGVVVLSSGSTLPSSVANYLNDAYFASPTSEIIAVGGPAVTAVSAFAPCDDNIAIYCITGATRYETAVNLAEFDFPAGDGITGFGVATGSNFPDALSGSALLGRYNYPLLLVAPTLVPPGVTSYLTDLAAAEPVLTGLVFGGTGVVYPNTADGLCSAAGIDAGLCDITP